MFHVQPDPADMLLIEALLVAVFVCTSVYLWRRHREQLQRIHTLNTGLDARIAELARSGARAQAVIDGVTAVSIIATTTDGTIERFSAGAERMLQYSASEMVGRRTAIIHDPEECLDRARRLSEETGRTIEGFELFVQYDRKSDDEHPWTYIRKDGSTLDVDLVISDLRAADGSIDGYLVVAVDITRRKRLESECRSTLAKLHISSERQSLAAAVAKVGVWEWDQVSDALTWDATMFDIYGVPATGMSYHRWCDAVHAEDLPGFEAVLQQVIREKGQGSADFRITAADGTVKHLSATERVVLDDAGDVSRVIGVNLDVTDRRTADAARERLRNDQLRFKDEFLSHVSHELRSPLTAVKQFTSILLSDVAGALNDEQRSYQQIVMKNTQQLQAMIDDLLDATRLETGKLTVEPESISVRDAVTDAVLTLERAAENAGLTISVDVRPDLPPAFADQMRLKQILIILLDNAIKFTPAGGAIHIRASLWPTDSTSLLIEMSDTGCGIAPEVGERVFERLYQPSSALVGSRKGLGLGLNIARELVTRQGGRIWLVSQPEEGSTFSFTVPVFSLTRIIGPLLKNGRWPADSAALVTVEASVKGGWPTRESQEEWSREARSLLQRCIMPDLDLLLPRMSADAPPNRFFIVASADDRGASILVSRIRGQFERLDSLKREGLAVTVFHSMLESCAPGVAAVPGTIAARLAADLEGHIKSRSDTEDPSLRGRSA